MAKTSKHKLTPKTVALLVLALTLAHGLIWWALTPAWAAPDEPGHYLYARLLADLRRRPLPSDLTAAAEAPLLDSLSKQNWWEYNGRAGPATPLTRLADDPVLAASGTQIEDEPPLFYSVPALFLRIASPAQPQNPASLLRWLRLWALLLRLAAAGAALLLGRSLWPDRPDRQFSLGLLAGTLPMVGFIGGSFNNDALALSWGALSFLLLARNQRLAALPVLGVGPIFIDHGLIFFWPLALIWLAASRHRKFLVLAALLVLGLLLIPNPRWAGGWRRAPAWTTSRAGDSLALEPDSGQSAHIWQYLSGKEMAALRAQPLRLHAEILTPDAPILTLSLTDGEQQAQENCSGSAPASCEFDFTPVAGALFVRLDVRAAAPIRFRLQLFAADDRPLLYNGSGSLPSVLGSPLLRQLEKSLPIPAGYFDRILAPDAWDAPAQFRYLLFGGFSWASFWGYFGWLSRLLPWPVYALLAGFSLLAGWGLLGRTLVALRRWKRRQLSAEDRVLALALLALALILLQIWTPMLGQPWQPQGRYLFPALLPIVFLLLLGWEAALPQSWRPHLPILLFGGLLVFNAVSWLIV